MRGLRCTAILASAFQDIVDNVDIVVRRLRLLRHSVNNVNIVITGQMSAEEVGSIRRHGRRLQMTGLIG